jgi:hypothetical protein
VSPFADCRILEAASSLFLPPVTSHHAHIHKDNKVVINGEGKDTGSHRNQESSVKTPLNKTLILSTVLDRAPRSWHPEVSTQDFRIKGTQCLSSRATAWLGASGSRL